MGGVTGSTTLRFYDLMDYFLFKIFFFMAKIACFLALCLQHFFCIRRMGVVTSGAFSRLEYGMDHPFVQADTILGVARITQIISRFFEE